MEKTRSQLGKITGNSKTTGHYCKRRHKRNKRLKNFYDLNNFDESKTKYFQKKKLLNQ